PVMWVPIKFVLTVPRAVANVAWWDEKFPEAYRERGLHRLTLRRGTGYRDVVDAFAERLVEVAARAGAPTLATVPSLEAIPSAFAEEDQMASSRSGENTVRFVLLTGAHDEMTAIRKNTSVYASTTKDWTPYPPPMP